jgi:hypothetical protein
MATSVEKLVESFPHPHIPAIEGQPNYETITDVTRLLNANAASIYSELGGGNYGHLSITLSTASYATLSPTPFIEPANPGTTPIIPPLATAAIIGQTVRDHEENLRIWRQYNNVNAALKQQLISAISNIYIRTLQDRHTGFANVSTRELIEHLLRTYGNITPTDLAENDLRFKAAYDPAEPIETLYSQLEDAMDYADAGANAYTPNQVVSNAYTLVFNTGMFPEACRDWRKLPAADKTWATFKTDFAEAYRDFRLSQTTTQTQGFHNANNAMESFVTDTADAFANLATATASDRKLMADLAASNQALLSQIASKDIAISNLQDQLATCNLRPPAPARRDGPPSRARPRRYHNTNYCWTHGWDVHANHTSQTCNRQATGHQTSATRSNTMGGADANKSKVS